MAIESAMKLLILLHLKLRFWENQSVFFRHSVQGYNLYNMLFFGLTDITMAYIDQQNL